MTPYTFVRMDGRRLRFSWEFSSKRWVTQPSLTCLTIVDPTTPKPLFQGRGAPTLLPGSSFDYPVSLFLWVLPNYSLQQMFLPGPFLSVATSTYWPQQSCEDTDFPTPSSSKTGVFLSGPSSLGWDDVCRGVSPSVPTSVGVWKEGGRVTGTGPPPTFRVLYQPL